MAANSGQANENGTRMSALWGTGGKRGHGSRNSVLWGKGGRSSMVALVATACVAMLVPFGASAGDKGKNASLPSFYIPAALLSQAQAAPKDTFKVIVQGDGSKDADKVAKHVAKYAAQPQTNLAAVVQQADLAAQSDKILKQQIKDEFSSITGVSATLTGKQITHLVGKGSDGLLSITPNSPVAVSGTWSSTQLWPYESGSANNWKADAAPQFAEKIPVIAIVDSGVQARADFGDRLLTSVNLSSLPNNSAGDGRGHGTFVAGIAAGGSTGITGANPAANLVSIDVMDDNGMGLTSDIINACQWILDHKDEYNIRVVNFSLHSTITAPFYIDPLDRAVEQLWFNGIVVVAAAGNYGSVDGPSGVLYSPGDDPFVITVGAADLNGSPDPKKAGVAPWSAWGSTIDGFGKPEVSAPGRYMIGPVPAGSTLTTDRPENVTSPGYIQLSGTSFAAPVVAGAAANILAEHPTFTPDQVKGALMQTARGLVRVGGAGGVGVIQANQAVKANNPPNPNAGLNQFVTSSNVSGNTEYSFDSASWNSAAQANASWNSVSWNSASWNSASWNSASWNSVSWNSASWNSASWNSASWNSASWNSASHEDAVEGDATADLSELTLSPDDLAALFEDPLLAPDETTLPDWLVPATTTTTTTATTALP